MWLNQATRRVYRSSHDDEAVGAVVGDALGGMVDRGAEEALAEDAHGLQGKVDVVR